MCLSMSSLVKKKALVAGSWTRGSWQWSYEGSEPHARIGYEANLVDAEAAWLRLTYTASGNPMDYRVRLVTTEPTYGGCRWWFLCPLARQDGGPPRRWRSLSSAGREVFRKPQSVRAHLNVMPGEREIRRPLSAAGCAHGHGPAIYQARAETALGVTEEQDLPDGSSTSMSRPRAARRPDRPPEAEGQSGEAIAPVQAS